MLWPPFKICPKCNGFGRRPLRGGAGARGLTFPCPACAGQGYILHPPPLKKDRPHVYPK
jgi:DnaJ-class molecular chaperone